MTTRKPVTQTRPHLVTRLVLTGNRDQDIISLGAKTQEHAAVNARAYITPATRDAVIEAIQAIERRKLKQYKAVSPEHYAGIPDKLMQAKITVKELEKWKDTVMTTTYASGNKFQPLPTFDEAWQTFSKVSFDLQPDRQLATRFVSSRPIEISPDEIREAVTHYWDATPISIRREAYVLLPDDAKTAISTRHHGNPEAAMNATRDYYLTQQAQAS